MPKYVIERELPGAGAMSSEELAAIACRSNTVLSGMNGRAQWLHSYVTDDRIICVYVADDPEAVREHGRIGPFPVTAIHRVVEVIDPTTADKAPIAGAR
jgi:hypothetical protein